MKHRFDGRLCVALLTVGGLLIATSSAQSQLNNDFGGLGGAGNGEDAPK